MITKTKRQNLIPTDTMSEYLDRLVFGFEVEKEAILRWSSIETRDFFPKKKGNK